MSGFLEFLGKLGAGRLIAMGIVTAALVAFFIFMTMRFTAPSMALLYSNLDSSDSGEIIAKLEALNIPYQLQGDGTTILVPDEQARRLRMLLAEEGLPSGDNAGYELFDDSSTLGQTSFIQNVNRLRAMEGELARTIRSIDSVVNARVHLVIPKRELFAANRQEPTASIVVKVRRNFGTSQVTAIQHLVAAAVPGLTPGRIAIVDDKGKLLSRGVEDEYEGSIVAGIQDTNASFEARLSGRIQSLVSSIVGPENSRIQVTASVNLDRITENSEIFDPNGRVMRSTNVIEQESSSTESDTDPVTVGNALPEQEEQTAQESTEQSVTRDLRSEETSNFEISRTTRTLIKEAGEVQRISVAVLVNGTYVQQDDGSRTYQPRSEEELAQIEALVRTAIGFSEDRGDEVRVINLQFSEFEFPTTELAEEEAPFLGFEGQQWLKFAETAIVAIVALLTALFVFRPLINRLLDISPGMPGELQPALASGVAEGVPQLAAPGHAEGATQAAITQGTDGTALLPGSSDPIESMIDVAQIEGQVKESSIRKVGEVVERHPDEAIAIMRTWLHDEN